VTSADIDSGITDGSPAGENKDEVINVILRTDQELRRSRYGPDTVSYRESESSRSVATLRDSNFHASLPIPHSLACCSCPTLQMAPLFASHVRPSVRGRGCRRVCRRARDRGGTLQYQWSSYFFIIITDPPQSSRRSATT
jgi:hypothetical protein